ncbi:MAG: bis(5'-nucleosyl)-tetraphosphatase (symmetrical) YqeK [Clostridia bacterium]|nr:bis(5'-nucleosyl)-tetraphosphatase (symmetrical) YqeK [Clostridia bacterium]
MMMNDAHITVEMLDELRASIQNSMSPKRYTHTCAVERMVTRLCELFCPECTTELRAAALLHDITKEESLEKQLQLCREFDIIVQSGDVLAPKTFHAKTAAAMIVREYPAFASEAVVSAVRWHTTGHADMTLGEQLLYLADYIDDSRMFPDCVRLRNYFWRADPAAMDESARIAHLYDTLIMSFDMTMRHLLDENATISLDTILARNALIEKKAGL